MLSLFFIKLLVAVLVVVGLTYIVEHVDPKIAGILSGYPTGSAISLFFFGFEISPEFSAHSAIFNMVGLIAMQAFIISYYIASMVIKKHSLIIAPLIAITGYLITIIILKFIEFNLFTAILAPFLSIFISNYLLKKIKNSKINKKNKTQLKVIILRAFFAALVIIFVTEIAKLVDAKWAGLFSAFPTTLFPLLLITHFSYGPRATHAIIKNVPHGLGSLIVYSLTVYLTYPQFGVVLGTCISFLMATIYLFFYMFIAKKIKAGR